MWFIDPDANTIELKLHFAYTPSDQDGDPDGPDNITVSPYGGVILAEDGEGVNGDKKILFANIQSPGYVFAIRGPFKKQR